VDIREISNVAIIDPLQLCRTAARLAPPKKQHGLDVSPGSGTEGAACRRRGGKNEERNAAIAETETPIQTTTNEEVAETPRKRSWWWRLAR
jgi:hypothetical protein